MQPVWRVSEKVAMLMHRAALDRDAGPERGEGFLEAGRAVDDGELGPAQATFVKVIEKRPPGGFAPELAEGPRPCS